MLKNKISLYDAAKELEGICAQVDDLEGDEIGELVGELLNRARASSVESVDRRIDYIRFAESQAQMAREMRNTWEKRLRTFERVAESIKANTLSIIKTNPGIPFEGSVEKFRVCKNAQPKLIHPLTIQRYQTEIILPDSFTPFLDEYIETKTIHVLNKEALKKDLKAGKEILGAALELGEHIRIGSK